MKTAIMALAFAVTAGSASAQQIASSNGYTTCPMDATQQGISVVQSDCGALQAPDFAGMSFSNMNELKSAMAKRDGFRTDVKTYGACVTQFINSYRRPGADANSTAPDEAACAHAWAEDQSTQIVRDFGKACIDFSNKTMMDANMPDYLGNDCYLSAGSGRG